MTRPLRVLHLEDHPADAALVRDRLAMEGLLCDIRLTSGKAAFEAALTEEVFDLIISDYNLPDYDGIAALKHALAAQPDVPVILVSGTLSEEEAVNCLQYGASDYLLKGRLNRLAPAVRRAIEETRTRVTRQQAEAALVQSEKRKAAVLDSVLDCIITMDADGVVMEFNAAAERTFGYSKAQAIGRLLADLIVPAALHQSHTDGLARYLSTGIGPILGKVMEMTARRADGSELPVELTVTAIHTEHAPIFTGVLRDITARRQAEQAQARLAAIVDGSDDAIFSMSLDNTILTWNAGAERLYGYTASEVVGQNKMLLVPSRLNGELKPLLERAARGLSGEPLETRRVRKDGSLVDISLTISPMIDAGGRVTSLSGIARDITGRKIAEQAVRDERDRAQRFLDAPEVILLALDLDGRITLANRYACSLLGWRSEELLGREWVETCVPARLRDDRRERFRNLLVTDVGSVESLVMTSAGEERLIEWRDTRQRDQAGRVCGTFSSGTDITERNQAIAALQTAEERMRFALQSANVGLWDMDYVTGVLRWSEILEAQYGLPAGKFGGTFKQFIELIHPEDRKTLIAAVDKAEQEGGDFSISNRSIWPDGSVHWLNGAGRFVLGTDRRPLRAIGVSLDVTERHELEEQHQQARKMEGIGQLAGGVAHDFNNLLTVILGYCEMMLEDLDSGDACHEGLVQIQKAGQSAAGLTRQLLAFSRKEIISPTLLDLNVVLFNMRAILRRLIREDIEIELAAHSGPAMLLADRGQIEQIVLNLAVNARDAMPKGGKLRIEIASAELDHHYARFHRDVRPGRYISLTVTDTGEGIPPDVQARLFEPFFTTKEPGRGTGLGLATVHGIVTQNGGSIDVSSVVNVGTTFRLYFPGAEPAIVPVEVPVPVVRVSTRRETIVVVEDEDGLRLLITSLLERLGYTVRVAANATEAIALFDEHRSIDLLLTDVVMPGGSGSDLSTRLVKAHPRLKVLYMSGYTDDAIVHHGVLDPGIAFLHKPFTSQALGLKIREVLDQ